MRPANGLTSGLETQRRSRAQSFALLLAALLLLAVVAVYGAQSIAVHPCFDDCITYTVAMGSHGVELVGEVGRAWRPWAIPAIYALFGPLGARSTLAIVALQTLAGLVCWMYAAWAAGRFLAADMWARWACLLLVAVLMLDRGYFRYNGWLLSDSLALSSLLLQLGAGMHLLADERDGAVSKGRRDLLTLLFLAASAVAMGARDANVMPAIGVLAYCVVAAWPQRTLRVRMLGLAATVVLLGLLQLPFAATRHLYNAKNLLVGIVLPDAEARDYFAARGMPASLAQLGATMPAQPLGNVAIAQVIAERKQVEALPEGVAFVPHFDGIYRDYLLRHPGWIAAEIWENHALVFEQSGPGREGMLAMGSRFALLRWLAQAPVPSSTGWAFGVSGLMIAMLYLWVLARGEQRRVLALPAVLMLLGAANAVMGFFGDLWEPNEMARHAYIGSVVLRLGVVLAAVSVLQAGVERGRSAARFKPGLSVRDL